MEESEGDKLIWNLFVGYLQLLSNRYNKLFICKKCGTTYQRLINICEKCGDDMSTEEKFKSYTSEFREDSQKLVDELIRTNSKKMAIKISDFMMKVALKLLGVED